MKIPENYIRDLAVAVERLEITFLSLHGIEYSEDVERAVWQARVAVAYAQEHITDEA